MSAKIMQDLALRLTADTAELKRGVQEANKSLRSIKTNSDSVGKKVSMSFAKLTAAFYAAEKALKFMESTIRSTQATNDAFDQSIAAAKGGVEFLQRAVANTDFTNLIQGFRDAAAAARDYAAAQDEIADIKRGVAWKSSDIDLEISELKVIAYDKNIAKATRLEAIERAISLEKQRQNDELKVSEMNLDAVLTNVQDTYGLTNEQLNASIRFLRDYGDIGVYGDTDVDNLIRIGNEIKNIQQQIQNQKVVSKPYDAGGQVAAYVASQFSDSTQELRNNLNKLQQDFNSLFANLGEDDKALVEIATDIGNNYSDVLRDSVSSAHIEVNNAVIGSNNRLRELISKSMEIQREGAVGGVTTSAAEATDATRELEAALEALGGTIISLPTINTTGFTDAANILRSIIDYKNQISYGDKVQQDLTSGMEFKTVSALPDINLGNWHNLVGAFEESLDTFDAVQLAIDGVGSAFDSLFSGTSEGIAGFIKDMLRMANSIIAVAIAEQIKANVASKQNLLSGGIWGMIGASVGVSALLGLWNSSVPKLASGGLAYGETLATVGEYASAKSNPEVIAPLSDLKGILADSMGGMNGEVRFEIEGDKLVGILSKYNSKKIYF